MNLYYRCGLKMGTEDSKNAMREALQRFQNGQAGKEWIEESRSGGGGFQKLRDAGATHPLEQVGDQLRKTMSWIL